MFNLKNLFLVVSSLNLVHSILKVSIIEILILSLRSNVDALKCDFLIGWKELAAVHSIISVSSTNCIDWYNRHDSFNIVLNTHVPESLDTIVVLNRTLTRDHKPKWHILILSWIIFSESRLNEIGIAISVIVDVADHCLSLLVIDPTFSIIHFQDDCCLLIR